jgi:probable HAF family extracellular repeat protein
MNHSCFSSVVLALVLYASSLAAQAQTTYSLTPIEPDEPELFVTDMNNQGDLVLTISRPIAQVDAFLWRDGVLIDLPDLMGGDSPYSEARGISNSGAIVGISLSAEFPEQDRGFLFRNGEISDVGAPAEALHFHAWDINEQGQIIANVSFADTVRGYLREGMGDLVALEPLPGGELTAVEEINASGAVVGFSDSNAGGRAVIWRDGEVQSLGVLPGTAVSSAVAINDRGQVVGSSRADDFSTVRAFLWDQGELLALAPAVSVARDINNAGQIVGSTFPTDGAVATVWENLVAYDLNDLIREDDPLKPFVTLTGADLINDRGQIVAQGVDSRDPIHTHTYVLTPTL